VSYSYALDAATEAAERTSSGTAGAQPDPDTMKDPIAPAVDQQRLVRCEHCDGLGSISFNPNLNPNAFPASTTAKCQHCDGTGIDDSANESTEPRHE